ncbi:hypothetical protein DIPPA_02628 [Diplonema papillatum]|nr:hypothetical protein DIPPA_02628 [Diplonema papillatum]|eukprot:gene15913-24329_t
METAVFALTPPESSVVTNVVFEPEVVIRSTMWKRLILAPGAWRIGQQTVTANRVAACLEKTWEESFANVERWAVLVHASALVWAAVVSVLVAHGAISAWLAGVAFLVAFFYVSWACYRQVTTIREFQGKVLRTLNIGFHSYTWVSTGMTFVGKLTDPQSASHVLLPSVAPAESFSTYPSAVLMKTSFADVVLDTPYQDPLQGQRSQYTGKRLMICAKCGEKFWGERRASADRRHSATFCASCVAGVI